MIRQWYHGPHSFKQAIVKVYGRTLDHMSAVHNSYIPVTDIITQRKMFTPVWAEAPSGNLGITFDNDATFKYTMTLNLYIKRPWYGWGNIFRHGSETATQRSPALWLFPDVHRDKPNYLWYA